jgi:hypothetical protein
MNISETTENRWTMDATGHLVGDDGFVCPATTEELFDRFPQYAVNMASKLSMGASYDAIKEMAQELWTLLLERRIVERFDPTKLGGASQQCFLFYVGRCLRNAAITIWSSNKREPVLSESTKGIDDDIENMNTVTPEHIHNNKIQVIATLDVVNRIYLDEFCSFIVFNRPEKADCYLRIIDNLAAGETYSSLARILGVSHQTIRNHIKALSRLARKFVIGSPETMHTRRKRLLRIPQTVLDHYLEVHPAR